MRLICARKKLRTLVRNGVGSDFANAHHWRTPARVRFRTIELQAQLVNRLGADVDHGEPTLWIGSAA